MDRKLYDDNTFQIGLCIDNLKEAQRCYDQSNIKFTILWLNCVERKLKHIISDIDKTNKQENY